MKGKMKNRIKRIIPDPPEAGYEAYLYLLTIQKKLQKEKYYGGWHLGQYVLDPYQFSSEDEELSVDYATADKVEYHIMEYGTAYDMAYKERIMLDQADGGIGAAKSPNWYNKTNGGGKYSVGYTGEKQVNLIESKLKAGEYKKGFSTKSEIKSMLNPKQTKGFQIRNLLFDPKFVNLYMGAFDEDPNPENFPDLTLFMPKKGSKDLPLIISGNQTGRGCVNSKHGVGMNHVEIPYSDWGKLSKSDRTRLGSRFNPRDERERKRQTEEDAARWVLQHCKEHNLTKKNGNMEVVWDITHNSIPKELVRQGWKKRQLDVIFRTTHTMIQNELEPDDNVLGWDDESLKADTVRHETFLKRKNLHLKENGGDYDWVYKLSVDVGYHKVFEEIERVGFLTKGLVLFYFKNKVHEDKYMFTPYENKHGVKFGDVRWKKWQKHFLKGFDIDTDFLPISKNKATIDGWYNSVKEEEKDPEALTDKQFEETS